MSGTEPSTFREAMARFPSGVTIVTTEDAAGERWGFTASAFTSLSMDPPLVLVCLSTSAQCADVFAATESFAVSILRPEHTELAKRFASRGADKFGGGDFVRGTLGCPVLEDSLATVECTLHTRYPGGDHHILIGAVRTSSVREGEPLVYCNRNFHALVSA